MHARHRSLLGALMASGVVILALPGLGQESESGDQPAPSSVWDMGQALEAGERGQLRKAARFPEFVERVERLNSFFEGASLVLKPRTYYFDRKRADGTRSRAWAIGGSLAYRSRWWNDVIAVGGAVYDSERLQGKADESGTGLLQPVQEGYTILGQAYVNLRHGEHQAVLYRQGLDLPYVNQNDSRMTPNTFEAYTLSGSLDAGHRPDTIKYVAGYIDKIRPRYTDRFIDMAEAVGVTEENRGLVTAGARIQLTERYAIGGVNHYVDDVINMAHAGTDYTLDLTDELGIRLESQFSHQASVGRDLLTGDAFETWNLGGRVAVSMRNLILKTAFSTTDDGDLIRSPYGSYPGYLSLMQKDFNRAGEDAWLVGMSYHFKEWGLDGLSMFANYAEGSDARDADHLFSGDQRELDVTADWQLKTGPARGLWVRVRWSTLDVEGVEDPSTDFRVVVNYELPIF